MEVSYSKLLARYQSRNGSWFAVNRKHKVKRKRVKRWFRPGGRTPHMKGVGMLVVLHRGVNFGFWSHLGCSGQNAIIFSREGLV